MNARDTFLKQELDRILTPGEKVLHTGTAFQGPLYLASLCGGVIGQLMFLTHYYVAMTDRRLILIETGMGFAGVKCQNRGVKTIDLQNVQDVKIGGMANQKKLTLVLRDGTQTVIRYNSMVKQVSGQKEFAKDAPQRLQSLAQKAV